MPNSVKSRRGFQLLLGFLLPSLIFLSLACTPSKAVPTLTPYASAQAVSSPTSTALAQAALPTLPDFQSVPTATAAALGPTPNSSTVTITAFHGRLSIRSGPDPVFDGIATLPDRTTAQVIARSVLDGGVQILIPGQNSQPGWVSIKTPYGV